MHLIMRAFVVDCLQLSNGAPMSNLHASFVRLDEAFVSVLYRPGETRRMESTYRRVADSSC